MRQMTRDVLTTILLGRVPKRLARSLVAVAYDDRWTPSRKSRKAVGDWLRSLAKDAECGPVRKGA
jgi:hypothetical protein